MLDTKKQAESPFTCIDARGLMCPMPLLKAKQALMGIPSGACIELLATDPGSVRDIQAFTRLTAHILLEYVEAEDHFVYRIQKGTESP